MAEPSADVHSVSNPPQAASTSNAPSTASAPVESLPVVAVPTAASATIPAAAAAAIPATASASAADSTPAGGEPGPLPSAATPAGHDAIEEGIVEVLKTVFDPEIPVNIYEMGLIYDIAIEPTGEVEIKMTLTSPGCPVAGSLPGEVQTKVERVPGVTAAKIDLVWEPAWDMARMSEAAKLQLGIY